MSKATVNVKNEDKFCFLYAILAVMKYDEIPNHRERVSNYTESLAEFSYKEEWFPMKMVDISKFERANPGYAITVFSYNLQPILPSPKAEIYKNPHVDIAYRSKASGRDIYLLLLQSGLLILLIFKYILILYFQETIFITLP